MTARFYDHGMVAMLTNNALITVSSYAEPRPKLLASVPEGEVHSWGIIPPAYTLSRSVEVLLSIKETVYLVDSTECEDRFLDIGPFSHISVSPDGKLVALYTKSGKAHVVSSDFQERLVEHDSNSKIPPKHVEWCGRDAVIAWEDEVHIVGQGDTSAPFIYDTNRVHVISGMASLQCTNTDRMKGRPLNWIIEHDGARIITNAFCEFIQQVPRDTYQVFGLFSESSPASILLDAITQLEAQSPKADDYIQLIRGNLTEAVGTCVSLNGTFVYVPSTFRPPAATLIRWMAHR